MRFKNRGLTNSTNLFNVNNYNMQKNIQKPRLRGTYAQKVTMDSAENWAKEKNSVTNCKIKFR